MLLRNPGGEPRCPRRWALAVGGGLTAVAVLVAGLSVQPRPAAAADKAEPPAKEADKKEPEKKEAPKVEPPKVPDPFRDVLEMLRKDDPATAKMLEELLKPGNPPGMVPRGPGAVPVPLPAPPAFPNPGVGQPDFDKEMQAMQEMMRQQMETLQKQMQAGGLRGGGFVVGPDGMRPFGPAGVGGRARLGIRVERPTDALAAQLDLPVGQGLVCADVPADSVAGKAGIKPHDVLLEVGGKAVPSNQFEFQKMLADIKQDTAVDLVVVRKGKKETIKGVKLPEAKAAAGFPGLEVPPAVFAPVPLPLPPAAGPAARADTVIGPGETARVEQVNDAFTVFYTKNGVKVTIAGTKDGGTAKAESIEVDDNGKTTRAESIDKLPKEYQEMARHALKAVK